MKGQIRKRGDTYSVIVPLGKDASGKKRYKWVTCRTKREAQRTLVDLIHQLDSGMLASPKGTVTDFIERWLKDYAKPNLSPTTYQGYESVYRSGIAPILGDIKLKDLRPTHIQKYISTKQATGISNTTVRHQITFLHSVLETAVKWQLLTRNPVDAVSMPKMVKQQMRTLDEQQADRILTEARGTRYYPIFALALYTGMRQSELLALQWRDVDLIMAELNISKSSHRLNTGEYVIKSTKTAKSNRRIALSPNTCLILRQYLDSEMALCAKLGITFNNDRLLFCEFDGKPLKPGSVRQYWKRLIIKLNYPHVRFHDLRHTMATLMLKQGINIKVISERLGHANTATTLNIYAHVTPGMQRQAVEVLDKILEQRIAKE